jgi:hypothetical protein
MKRRIAAAVSGTTTTGIAHSMLPNINIRVNNNAN